VPSCARPVEDYRAVGDAVLGHVFNVIGESLDTDDIGPLRTTGDPPQRAAFDQLEPHATMFETGIKSSTSSPVRPGWQDRPLRWCGRR